MKYKNIALSYLLTSFLPPITLIITELATKPEDCGQCTLLILVGAFLILVRLLLVHTVQFLGLIRLKNRLLDLILLIVCSFGSSLILVFHLLEELLEDHELEEDWNFILVPAIVNFLCGFFTLWVLTRIRTEAK